MARLHGFLSIVLGITTLSACASWRYSQALKIQQQAYSSLPRERVIEASYPRVWKAVEEVFRKYAVLERDPEEVVSPKDWKMLKRRTLDTDWIFTKSDEWYSSYMVNHSPRREYLQSKVKVRVITEPAPGGVRVRVETDEEVQPINEMGQPLEFKASPSTSHRLAGQFLERVAQQVLSLPSAD